MEMMKTKTNPIAKQILRAPYQRVLVPEADNDGYSAEILEFPGCFAQGDSAQEALNNLEKAAEVWIEAAVAQGTEIPVPFLNRDYGGKIALRLPRSIHRQATRMAERDCTSLNQFLLSAIAARVGAEDLYSRICRTLERQRSITVAANIVFQSGHLNVFNSGSRIELAPESIERLQRTLSFSSAEAVNG